MSSIALPTKPGVRTASPRLLDFGVVITPPQGGASQRVNRLGNRWSIDVVAPTSSSTAIGLVLIARLTAGLTAGVILPFPQDFDTGTPGAPVIDGAGQTGTSLKLRGLMVGYTFREGQFFSIIYGGRRYLHMVGAATTFVVDANGKITLPIIPMLRISPNDGDTAEVAQPMIEGFMSGNVEWQLQTAPFLDVKFTVTEAE